MTVDRGHLYRENDLELSRDRAELAALMGLSGMTRARIHDLLAEYRSPREVWATLRTGKAVFCLSREESARLAREAAGVDPADYLERIRRRSIGVAVPGEEDYPPLLLELADPPVLLYYRGKPPGPAAAHVSIVGARKASAYGLEVTRWLVESLCGYSPDIVIVSGAAYGIDTAAHVAALNSGGNTVAVLGCGVDIAYPRSNAALLNRMAQLSCLISEYPPGTTVMKHHFPERNRIIAGMSAVTVVTEAAEGSGSIITADLAVHAGRALFSVPGPLFAPGSSATNSMIKNGAYLLNDPVDITEALGIDPAPTLSLSSDYSGEEAGSLRRRVLEAIASGATEPGELAVVLEFSAADVLSAVACLELEGKVARGAGGRYQVTLPGARR